MVADLVIRNGMLGSRITGKDENTVSTYGEVADGTICLVSASGNGASFVKQVSNINPIQTGLFWPSLDWGGGEGASNAPPPSVS